MTEQPLNDENSRSNPGRQQPPVELKAIQHVVNWLGALQIVALVAMIAVVMMLNRDRGGFPSSGGAGTTTAVESRAVGRGATSGPNELVTAGTAASAKSAAVGRGPFGGPYDFKETYQKVVDFEQCRRFGMAYTKADRLSLDLLRKSITENENTSKYGKEFQRYNFVIAQDDVTKKWLIKVAVWRSDDELKKLKLGNTDGAPFGNTVGTMVNFFPEESGRISHFPPESPRWVSVASAEGLKRTGIFDALSKHFMLANVPIDGGMELFDRDRWFKAEVAYAGEILVDVKGNYYVLNNGSGTYRPHAPYLEAAARFFEQELGVAPVYLQVPKPDPGDIRPYFTSGRTNLR